LSEISPRNRNDHFALIESNLLPKYYFVELFSYCFAISLYLKLVYEPFSKSDARLFNPTIEHRRNRDNGQKYPAPESAILHERAPTLLSDIGKDDISKQVEEWEVPHVQTEGNQCDPTQYGPLNGTLELS
jgi:hypothetical protein